MNISSLTTVMLSALLVTSGLVFAVPGGTADVNAGASGNVSAGGADATDSDRDRRPADDDGSDADERDGVIGRLGVAVTAVVGGGTNADSAERGDDARADGVQFETRGDASVDRSERPDDASDARERAGDRVRSIHDHVRAFLSGSLDGDLGVRIGLDVFGGR